ncbi:hypothetical protein [Mucilaginibacter sp. RCC_168]
MACPLHGIVILSDIVNIIKNNQVTVVRLNDKGVFNISDAITF